MRSSSRRWTRYQFQSFRHKRSAVPALLRARPIAWRRIAGSLDAPLKLTGSGQDMTPPKTRVFHIPLPSGWLVLSHRLTISPTSCQGRASSRFRVRLGVLLPFLEDGQNVPGRVLEPCDRRPGLARDPPIIMTCALVALELD